jgi:23S rRNA (pseudouridine1915-N3)-methyltransferase
MINIICVGKLKEQYIKDMVADYEKRISKYHKINIIELKEDISLEKEAENMFKNIKPTDYVIALAIEGKQNDSVAFANMINDTFNHFGTIDFIIGESNGIAPEIKKRANYLLSFSKMTFPHGLFRSILLEQIYRSFKIINNEKYHK